MKINVRALYLVMLTSVWPGGQVLGQSSPNIDPQTGQPVGAGPGTLNPVSFLPSVPAAELAREAAEREHIRSHIEPQPSPNNEGQSLLSNPTNSAYDPSALAGLESMCATDPAARQKLTQIRDQDVRAFSEGQGKFSLFQELNDVNRVLADEGSTYALFKGLGDSQPALARQCEPMIEPQLVRHGDYKLCLQFIGNPESRFQNICRTYERMHSFGEQQIQGMERSEAIRLKVQGTNEMAGRPPAWSYPRLNSGKFMIAHAKTRFVGDVCVLVEILVGSGHEEVAEKIRGEAVAMLDDPRLQSSISHAEEHIKDPATVPSAAEEKKLPAPAGGEASAAFTPPVVTPMPPPVSMMPAGVDPQTGMPVSAAQSARVLDPATGLLIDPATGMPAPGAKPVGANDPATRMPVSGVRSAGVVDPATGLLSTSPAGEIRALIATGQHVEALKRLQLLYQQQTDIRVLGAQLSIWLDLAGKYAPANEALIKIRDDEAGEFSDGGGNADLFKEIKSINDHLDEEDATCTLYLDIHGRNPQLAGTCYPYAEASLMHRGEYELCLQNCGDMQARYGQLRDYLEQMRSVLPLWRENQKKNQVKFETAQALAQQTLAEQIKQATKTQQEFEAREAQYRQQLWDRQRTNMPDPDLWDYPTSPPSLFVQAPPYVPPARPPITNTFHVPIPAYTPPDMGMMVTNQFVTRIRAMVEILAGTGHLAEAGKIRDEAVAELDDPRLESAVSDAEERIKKHGAAL